MNLRSDNEDKLLDRFDDQFKGPNSDNGRYKELIDDLKSSLLRDQPLDLYAYCLDYFSKLHVLEGSGVKKSPKNSRKYMKPRRSFREESFDPSKLIEFDKTENIDESVRAKIDSAFNKIAVLSHMSRNSRNLMASAFKPHPVSNNDVIITQGEKGDYFYVIVSGHFRVEASDDPNNLELSKELATLEDGGFFGELALLHDKPRNATVKCTSPEGGLLWRIDRSTFKSLICQQNHLNRQLKLTFLRSMALFSDYSSRQLDSLSDALTEVEYNEPGYAIMEEGDKADALYFILEGRVFFEKQQNNSKSNITEVVRLSESGKGDYFGEMALINHDRRSATVRVLEPVKLLRLTAKDFDRLMGLCHTKLHTRINSYVKLQRN